MLRLLPLLAALCLPSVVLAADKASSRDKADMLQDELGMPAGSSGGMPSASARGAKLSLQFFDAVTGNPVPGATVRFEGQETVTNERGIAQFPFPDVPDDQEATLEAEFQKSGRRVARGESVPERERAYVTSRVPVRFMLGTVFFKRFSISPALEPGKLRIVLEWDSSPRDLDAHLTRAGGYHISFRNMKSYQDVVFLDRDDMDGYGPETITIEKVDADATYSYFVHDYTNGGNVRSGDLAKAKARVMVFDDKQLLRTFMIGSGTGVVWKVLEVVNGDLRSVDAIVTDAPSP